MTITKSPVHGALEYAEHFALQAQAHRKASQERVDLGNASASFVEAARSASIVSGLSTAEFIKLTKIYHLSGASQNTAPTGPT